MKKIIIPSAITLFVMLSLSKHAFSQSGQKFSTGGNTLTEGEFFGVNNAYPLIIKVNAVEWMRITPTGNVGIGTSTPADKLHVSGTARMLNAEVENYLNALSVKAQSAEFAFSLIGDIKISSNRITSTTGTISFDANNLTTTGTINAGTIDAQNILQNGNPLQTSQWTTQPDGSISYNGTATVNNLNVNQSVNIGSFAFTNGTNQFPPNITDSIRTPYRMALSSSQRISLDAENVQVGNFVSFDDGTGTLPGNQLPIPPNFGGLGMLSVQGNINANGNINSTSIQTQQLNIIGGASRIGIEPGGVRFTSPAVNQMELFVGVMDSATGIQEICTHNGDLLLQSHTGLTSNTLINSDNPGNVGIGTNTPSEKLTVQGNSFISGNMRIGNLTGVGDRPVVVDANGNLKSGNPLPQFGCAAPWCINGNANTIPGTDFIGTTDAQDLVFKTNGVERMRIHEGGGHPGNVGIGTDDPQKKLHIITKHTTCSTCQAGSHEGIRMEEQTTYTDLNTTVTNVWDIQPYGGTAFAIRNPGQNPVMLVHNNGSVDITGTNPQSKLQVTGNGMFTGNVGIGTAPDLSATNYRLSVCGTIHSKEVVIEVNGWCDYVFDKNYERMKWHEKLAFINVNKHLPAIASGADIETNGLKTGATMQGMMQNIEENTLDVIDLYQIIQKQNEAITQLKKEVEQLKEKK